MQASRSRNILQKETQGFSTKLLLCFIIVQDICDTLEGVDESEEEIRDLKESVEKLQALSEYFVQQHHDEQNLNKIHQISKMLMNFHVHTEQNSINTDYQDDLAVEGRRFIREGDLNLNSSTGRCYTLI